MQTQIREWGNSQEIRLSKVISQGEGLAINRVLDVMASDGTITLKKFFRHKTLEERAETFGGKLNLDSEFVWGEPVGREVC